MEVLIPLIQKDSKSRATKAVKNMIEDLQKRNKLMKIADKSPAGWNTAQEYISDDFLCPQKTKNQSKKEYCFFFSANQHT